MEYKPREKLQLELAFHFLTLEELKERNLRDIGETKVTFPQSKPYAEIFRRNLRTQTLRGARFNGATVVGVDTAEMQRAMLNAFKREGGRQVTAHYYKPLA